MTGTRPDDAMRDLASQPDACEPGTPTASFSPAQSLDGQAEVFAQPLSIYLDQWVWVELAKASWGRPAMKGAAESLAKLRRLDGLGLVVCPLSQVHYMESNVSHQSDRRVRLAKVMAELSHLRTLACPASLLIGEIDAALQRRFGRPRTLPGTRVIGVGVGHAFGHPFEIPVGRLVDESLDEWAQRKVLAQYQFEVAVLAGLHGDGPMPGADQHAAIAAEYAEGERRLARDFLEKRLPRAERRKVLLASEFWDIRQMVLERLRAANVPKHEFLSLREADASAFIEELDSRNVSLLVRCRRHDNPAEHWKDNDLRDMAALCAATAYCNVVVTEKHFCHLLNTSGAAGRYGTKVISRLTDLPSVLDSLLCVLSGG
jgi:hypothetical protein